MKGDSTHGIKAILYKLPLPSQMEFLGAWSKGEIIPDFPEQAGACAVAAKFLRHFKSKVLKGGEI